MRGTRIPAGQRIINDANFPPVNPADQVEANADHYMILWDNGFAGTYHEDDSVDRRHIKPLRAREQATPNLTLEVHPGRVYFGSVIVDFAGGNSPTFTAPVSNPRIDLLVLNSSGTLVRVAGTEAASPVAPTIPTNTYPIVEVRNVVGQTKIRDNDTQEAGHGFILTDARPNHGGFAVGSFATTTDIKKLAIIYGKKGGE